MVDFKRGNHSNLVDGAVWWFVFETSQHPLISRFLKKKYSHVWAFCSLGNVVLIVEPLMGVVNITVMEAMPSHFIEQEKKDGNEVIVYAAKHNSQKFIRRGWFISCASYLAYTVGLPSFCVTPWQLRKKLLTCGGEIIRV